MHQHAVNASAFGFGPHAHVQSPMTTAQHQWLQWQQQQARAQAFTPGGHAPGYEAYAQSQQRMHFGAPPPTVPPQNLAPALDAQWQKGLRAMCADEAAVRWADHVVMIASLEQLHHHWAEAAHLFALAQPAYVDAHGDESLELAELMNSRGECYLELGCRGRARVCLDQAHAIVLETNGADDPSLASITANRSKLLSEEGDEVAAREGFDDALKVMRLCVDKLRRDADTNGLVMCQVLHARVLKLYSEHERLCGNDGAADAMAAEVKRLEMSYCFLA